MMVEGARHPFPPSRRYGCLRFELMVGEESNRETTRLEGKGEGGGVWVARAPLTPRPHTADGISLLIVPLWNRKGDSGTNSETQRCVGGEARAPPT